MRIYGLLLRLYPRAFRSEVGPLMMQLFRDQYRDAWKCAGVMDLGRFWFRILVDTASSVCREHLNQMKGRCSMSNILVASAGKVRFGRMFFIITFLLFVASVVSVLFLLPKVYASTARIEITGQNGEPWASNDPYRVQTAFETIKSRRVLDPVIEELNLTRWFGEIRGHAVTQAEAHEALVPMIDLRQTRNTSLVEVRVSTDDQQISAAIANKIAEVFGKMDHPNHGSVLIDAAQPESQPVRPNVPLGLLFGFAMSLAGGVVLAGVLSAIAWVIRRQMQTAGGAAQA